MDGWIKLHRCTLEKAIWKLSDAQRIVFFTVLMLANHEEKSWIWKGEKFKCVPGQFITSIDSLAKTAKVSRKSVRTALLNLEKLDFLANESAKTGRLVTVLNWGFYQSQNETSAKISADERQSIGKASAPNKNDKNDKNDKKNIYSQNIRLTDAEFERLVAEFGNQKTMSAINYLSNYKIEKGYKTKNDNLTLRRWVMDAVNKKTTTKQQSAMDYLNSTLGVDTFEQYGNEETMEIDGVVLSEND